MATKKTAKKKVQYWGTGRRKKAIARVRLIPGGEGAIVINKRDITEYFPQDTMKLIVRQPLVLTNTLDKYDVFVNVCGGGYTGQAGAIRHGIAALLSLQNPNFVARLKRKVTLPVIRVRKNVRNTALKKQERLRSSANVNFRFKIETRLRTGFLFGKSALLFCGILRQRLKGIARCGKISL